MEKVLVDVSKGEADPADDQNLEQYVNKVLDQLNIVYIFYGFIKIYRTPNNSPSPASIFHNLNKTEYLQRLTQALTDKKYMKYFNEYNFRDLLIQQIYDVIKTMQNRDQKYRSVNLIIKDSMLKPLFVWEANTFNFVSSLINMRNFLTYVKNIFNIKYEKTRIINLLLAAIYFQNGLCYDFLCTPEYIDQSVDLHMLNHVHLLKMFELLTKLCKTFYVPITDSQNSEFIKKCGELAVYHKVGDVKFYNMRQDILTIYNNIWQLLIAKLMVLYGSINKKALINYLNELIKPIGKFAHMLQQICCNYFNSFDPDELKDAVITQLVQRFFSQKVQKTPATTSLLTYINTLNLELVKEQEYSIAPGVSFYLYYYTLGDRNITTLLPLSTNHDLNFEETLAIWKKLFDNI